MAASQYQKILFGLKVRQLRQEKNWSFEDLNRACGISISYLNEIEKGKKFPQAENQQKLAASLGTTVAFLNSPEMVRQYAPLGELLRSNFLNELPLDFFGIELQQVVEIIARAPERVNAFISATLEIARNYSVREEHFFLAALRAYQELRNNYFEEIETEALEFVRSYGIPETGGVDPAFLAALLKRGFNCNVRHTNWESFPELQGVRCLYNPHQKEIMLHEALNAKQRSFYLAKELGFQVLGAAERPYSSLMLSPASFEEVLNNYRAAYFAVAILINRSSFSRDLSVLFEKTHWDPQMLEAMMEKYNASPEVLFQRFNILTKDFGLDKVFFLRFIHHTGVDKFEIDKELHLNRKHQPQASGLREHYCRRWISIQLLRDLNAYQAESGDLARQMIGIQRITFANTGEEYLCIAIAKPGFPTIGRNISVTLGVLLDDHAKQTIGFWQDPSIPETIVNVTCEQCHIQDCTQRAAPAVVLQRRDMRRAIQHTIDAMTINSNRL